MAQIVQIVFMTDEDVTINYLRFRGEKYNVCPTDCLSGIEYIATINLDSGFAYISSADESPQYVKERMATL